MQEEEGEPRGTEEKMIAGSRSRHAAPQTAAGLVRSRRGFTLVEVAVALLVLTAALGGTSYAVARAVALGRSQRETALAMEAALSVVETVKGTPFDQVFVRFNQDPLDDPMGLASPGNFLSSSAPGARESATHTLPSRST